MTSPSAHVLQQLHHLDTSSPVFQDELCNVLYGEEYARCVPNLKGDDPAWLVDYLDKALDVLDPSCVASRKCLRELRSICSTKRILPKSCTPPSHTLDTHSQPFAFGGFGDVYHGTLNGSKVCIKHVRVYMEDMSGRAIKAFYQETVMWKRLAHPNIVPLLGITTFPRLQLISEWMSGGDLPIYIKAHPDTDRLGLLSDIANGLHHLHLSNVIHGDLKGQNILVDGSGRARIADFGLAMVTKNLDSIPSNSSHHGHTPRWSAPEVLREGKYSREADIFSFAMVMYEVFAGAVPFSGKPSSAATVDIMNGVRPPQPKYPTFTEELWLLMQRCWDQDPHLRPRISEALELLLTFDVPIKEGPITEVPATGDHVPKTAAIQGVRPSTGLAIVSPSSPALLELQRLTYSSPNFHNKLRNALYGKEYKQCVPDLGDDDLAWLVDYLDNALDVLEPSGVTSRKCLRELRSICGARAILPTSYTLSSHLLEIQSQPFASGSFGDVYHGTLNGSSVCVKDVRVYTRDGPEVVKAFCQEAAIWKRVVHPNVVPLLGITISPRLQLISDWMSGGDLPGYIRRYPDADRLGLLFDVANGLDYLHSCNVIHGDLKGQNILVDNTGHARIADFGLARITKNPHSLLTASQHHGHTPRWSAPEVLKEWTYNKEADVFSFAMVMYEVFTGTVPFDGKPSATAMSEVMSGARPPRPTHPVFTEELWSLMKRCWAHEPHLRPGTSEALEVLFNVGTPVGGQQSTQTLTVDDCGPQTTAIFSDAPQSIGPTAASKRPPVLRKLLHLNTSAPEFHRKLYNILYGEEYVQGVKNLQSDELASLVDYLDNALGGLIHSSATFRKCLRELRNICGDRMILPASYACSSRLIISPKPFASGGHGDVYQGTLDGSNVCVKRLRVYAGDDQSQASKTFCKAVVIWKHLDHPNIVPLLGVTIAPFQLISKFVPGSDLLSRIETYGVERSRLLCDVAEGLYYLHSCNVVHGNLKGRNILVNNSGHARITDFGLATVAKGLDSIRSAAGYSGHAPRWTAPEVLRGGTRSKKADIFSFAMVMIEAFTGAVPFSDRQDTLAMHDIMNGARPLKPTHATFTPRLWELMQNCWSQEPRFRPTIYEVLGGLHSVDCPPWKRLITQSLSTDKHISLVTTIFSDRSQVETVRNLCRVDAQAFVDKLDEVMGDLAPQVHKKCLRYLYRICGRQAFLPRSLEVPLCYDPKEDPISRGELADVWKGQYQGQEVAARVFSIWRGSDAEEIKKRFCREIVTWRALHHPNVLPLLGVTMTENRLVMVSEWTSRGNIMEFTKAHPTVDRLGLLRGVTRGLIYMHNRGVIHGDLRGANIVIDNDNHSRLTGFNLVTITSEQQNVPPPLLVSNEVPWMSPELLSQGRHGSGNGHPTKESDCYALGMVIYEVLSGQAPFATCKAREVAHIVQAGERPERPQGDEGRLFTDEIWELLKGCWRENPGDRLDAKGVLVRLGGDPSVSWPADDTDEDAEIETDDQSITLANELRPPSTCGSTQSSRKTSVPKGKWVGRVLMQNVENLKRASRSLLFPNVKRSGP